MLGKSCSSWKLLISCSLLLASCGYRWNLETPFDHRPSIAISPISGDEEGALIHEIARALSAAGLAAIVQGSADYRLEITLSEANTETIGYRFNRQKVSDRVDQNLVATEGRRSLTIEATLYEGSSEKIAYGPYRVSAFADYDFLDGDSIQDLTFIGPQGNQVTVLPFSLGQLEPNEAAQEAATYPLYVRLSRKLVDALAAEW